MRTANDPPSASPSNVRGVAVIAAITVAVAGWLYSHRPEDAALSTSILSSDMKALPGFRPDAWYLPDDDLLGFVEIPAGTFRMGSDPKVDPRAFVNERWSASSNQGTVDLPGFYIGRYEVTVAQHRAFVAATDFRVDAQALGGLPDHPVGAVSWPDALAYCRWLDTTLRQWPHTPPPLSRLLNDGWRVTLPNEAQWEKAARGTDGRIFPWGDEPRPDRANYGGSNTTPVGSFVCPECSDRFDIRYERQCVGADTKPLSALPVRSDERQPRPRCRCTLGDARWILRRYRPEHPCRYPWWSRPRRASSLHRISYRPHPHRAVSVSRRPSAPSPSANAAHMVVSHECSISVNTD